MLFPESLSTNNKIHVDISFDKALGRSEHGVNLQRRKVNRRGLSNFQTIDSGKAESNISKKTFKNIKMSVQKHNLLSAQFSGHGLNANSSKLLEQIRLREQNIHSVLEKPS